MMASPNLQEVQLRECEAYYQMHNVRKLIHDAVVQLCSLRPAQPFTFLKEYFAKLELEARIQQEASEFSEAFSEIRQIMLARIPIKTDGFFKSGQALATFANIHRQPPVPPNSPESATPVESSRDLIGYKRCSDDDDEDDDTDDNETHVHVQFLVDDLMNQRSTMVEMRDDFRVYDIKRLVLRNSPDVDNFLVIFNQKVLNSMDTIKKCGVVDNDRLFLVPRMKSGPINYKFNERATIRISPRERLRPLVHASKHAAANLYSTPNSIRVDSRKMFEEFGSRIVSPAVAAEDDNPYSNEPEKSADKSKTSSNRIQSKKSSKKSSTHSKSLTDENRKTT